MPFRYTERTRVLLLIVIMAVVAVLSSGVASALLYRTALAQQAARLVEMVTDRAAMIQVLVRTKDALAPAFTEGIVLSLLRDADASVALASRTEETVVGRRDGDSIVFLLQRNGPSLASRPTLPFDSALAQPMRRALQGQSGSMTGVDYRGVRVLAAYEPVAGLGWGVVSKIDLSEVQAPFFRALALAIGIALVLVVVGARLFVRVSNPLLRQIADSEHRFRSIIDTAGDAIVNADGDGRIVLWNRAAESAFGYTADDAAGKPLSMLMPVGTRDRFGRAFAHMSSSDLPGAPGNTMEVVGLRRGGAEFPMEMTISTWRSRSGTMFTGILRDISERKSAEAERNRLFAERQAALAEVKQLSGILPICASCKRIRTDEGAWQQVETYVRDHSDAQFSHGLCPECARKLYPEMHDEHGQMLE